MLQTAAAAGIAWLLAHDVLGHRNAFFAPISAVIALGLAPGKRTRRTVEMVIGVAVGIAVGELLISAIGTGAAQVGLVVLLAMAAVIALGGGPFVASQAATSAVLVATVRTSSGGLVPTRFVDALVGGTVGIAVVAVAPRNPATLARRAAAPVFAHLARALEDVATALETRDLDETMQALERARAGDLLVARLREALVLASETTRLSPSHWSERGRIERYTEATIHLELAVRNVRVLARAAVRAVELEPTISPRLPASIRELATAVRELEQELDHGGERERLVGHVIAAAANASLALNEPRGFAIDVVVGQVRSLATDLLRTLGVDQATAVRQLRRAVGEHESKPSHSPR